MKLKKGVKRFLLVFIILSIVGLSASYLIFYEKKPKTKVKLLNEIKEYGYKLSDNKSDKYKKLFYELEKILSEKTVDEKKYVSTISKMFIFDFYSLSDKLAKTDVGGADFVYSKELADFLEKAEDTIYKYVESNLYGERKQNLPTVDKVEIESIEKSPFTFLEQVDEEAYTVKVKWEYTDTSTSSGYQDSATLIFIHDDKKIVLVELE